MAKHTPGPWLVTEGFTGEFLVSTKVRWLARVREEEDARLIAAAPDLLAVLQDIVAADGMRPGHVAYLSRADITAMARAAISKATS